MTSCTIEKKKKNAAHLTGGEESGEGERKSFNYYEWRKGRRQPCRPKVGNGGPA